MADLKQQWRADARGLRLDRDAHLAARTERRTHQRSALDRPHIAEMAAHIDKPTFTRADMVELIGAQVPIDAPGEPRALIEQIVNEIGIRSSAPRETHHREGNEKFTVDARRNESSRWSTKPTTITPNRSPERAFTSPAATTNTPPHTTCD